MSDPTRCVFCGHLPVTCDCSQNEYEDDYYEEDDFFNDYYDDDDEHKDIDDPEW